VVYRSPARADLSRAAAVWAAAIVLVLAAVAPRPAAAQGAGKARVAFVGDSLSDGYWEGFTVLAGRDACVREGLELGRFAKNSTGLTRPDRLDWAVELRHVADSFRPHVFVMSAGLNDRQSVVEHGQVTLDNTPEYEGKYKERITAVLAQAAAAKAALLWIGLPAMRAAATDKDARDKNRLYAEAIAAFGDPDLQYVEPWKLNGAGPDAFASYGPDQSGRMVQLRTSDGEHFTVAGEAITAVYLLPKILASVAGHGITPCAKGEGQTQ
jgi:uncharacterized protein